MLASGPLVSLFQEGCLLFIIMLGVCVFSKTQFSFLYLPLWGKVIFTSLWLPDFENLVLEK